MQNITYKKRWKGKVLGELLNFLREQHTDGVSIRAVANVLGTTPQCVSAMFVKDDTKLSKVEWIVNKYGYRLSLSYPASDRSDAPVPKQYRTDNNLGGLIKYVFNEGWKISNLSVLTHLNLEVLNRAFSTGDIKMSTLFNITDSLGIDIIWAFNKIY